MPDEDVVLAKVAAIQRCLRRIKDVTGLDPARLEELDAQDIFVLNLKRDTSHLFVFNPDLGSSARL